MFEYPRSQVEIDGTVYAMVRAKEGKRLSVQGDTSDLVGTTHGDRYLCPLTAENAAMLRKRLPWLCPQPLGLKRSAGCGDRLGLATPGHIRAIRMVGGFAPVFAQQSMRENARTHRSPQQVMDDAMFGVFQEGWQEPWGADADHLKTTEDIDICVAAGYTFYTIDPGDHVDNEAHEAPLGVLLEKVSRLPWGRLGDDPDALWERYLERAFELEDLRLEFDRVSLARAAAKYGGAIAHTAAMYRHLATVMGKRVFELEVSVDETEMPTSPLEHYYVASELRRLGVQWVSLAPRYIGRFEKGVDYIGDLDQFESHLKGHAAIARAMGPYKLSIHSGSDKFSVYPIYARQAGELVHLKTAGTSYLEALRAIAAVAPRVFREILAYALERYADDSATYHVSADVARVPAPADLGDEALAGVLELFDGREVLHVTFGSILDRYGADLLEALDRYEEEYCADLEAHFRRHLAPLKGVRTGGAGLT